MTTLPRDFWADLDQAAQCHKGNTGIKEKYEAGKGPHAFKVVCGTCGKFLRWARHMP